MKHALALLLALSVGGCAAGDSTIVGAETAGAGYRNWPLQMRTTQGETVSYKLWLRPHNKDGLLGLCGYIEVESASGVSRQLLAALYQTAEISLNDQAVGTGSYLPLRQYSDRRASCVRTTVAWNESFNGPLRLNVKFDRGARVTF